MAQLQGSTLSSSQLFDTPCGSLRAIFMVIKASTTTKKTKPGESFHLYMYKENEYTKFKQKKKKKSLFMGVALLAVAHLNGCKAHRTQSVAEERRRCVVRWAEATKPREVERDRHNSGRRGLHLAGAAWWERGEGKNLGERNDVIVLNNFLFFIFIFFYVL
jgi:hypothetical protein